MADLTGATEMPARAPSPLTGPSPASRLSPSGEGSVEVRLAQ
jgi:hypothetical protein